MLPPYRNPDLDPLIRTLSWCVGSRSLVDIPSPLNMSLPEFNETIEIIDESESAQLPALIKTLCDDPTPLKDWLERGKSQRLGHRFEHFWHFYWLQYREAKDCVFNRQICHEGKTLGELDAVFYRGAGHPVEHVELAYKFYLGWPQATIEAQQSGHNWIGPNARDRLDLKLKQMSEKQLKMLDDSNQHLPAHWRHQGYQPKLLMKGWLFYPLAETLMPPNTASRQHNRGYWLKHSQLDLLPRDKPWLILPRKRWLEWTLFKPEHLNSECHLVNTKTLKDRLGAAQDAGEKAIMFVALGTSPADERFLEEQQRYILVDDQWPTTTC